MKSQWSNGTIFHHEITFMLLYCSVFSWGNSLSSLLRRLMACRRVIHMLWLTKIILNIRTHITCLSLLSILTLHLLPFVVTLILLKVLLEDVVSYYLLLILFFIQLVFERWPSHWTQKLYHLAEKRKRLLIASRSHWSCKTNQNWRINTNKNKIVDLHISR